jgi:hypothetical protein
LACFRFWKKKEKSVQRTVLQVQLQTLTSSKVFVVDAQSPEKALELMRELQKEGSA